MNGEDITCDELLAETQPSCSCEDCVRELQFKYTGKSCSSSALASGKCTDSSPNPFVAEYTVTGCDGDTEVYGRGEAEQGQTVKIGAPAGVCLPECMSVAIAVASGLVTQIFEIDSTCDSEERGLVLVSDYGAFQSIGYTCSETDTHNCMQDVNYDFKICNTGTTDEELYEWSVDLYDEQLDLLDTFGNTTLNIGECKEDSYTVDVDRCDVFEGTVKVTCSAVDPVTGTPPGCEDSEEITFEWDPVTLPPSPQPSPVPSLSPSASPTEICTIDVALTGCPEYNTTLENNCQGRPQVIEFRYNGGGCSQSDNLQSRQKFSCEDVNGGPPTVKGAPGYVVAMKAGGEDLYFSGPVAVGETFILNESKEFDKLSADMTIQMFDANPEEGGTLFQTVDVHLSCSQKLFLFDRFGATQVVEWSEVDGRVVSSRQSDIRTGTIEIKLDTTSDIVKPIRLTEMNMIASALSEPIDYTPDVAGVLLEPGTVIQIEGPRIDIDLSVRTRYTFFLALNGETLDGSICNGSSFLECTVGYNLDPVFTTLMPTASPTSTPYPTQDPETASCEVESAVSCSVTSIEGITCDEIKAPADNSCPAGSDLTVAYLKYDGSLGPTIFVEALCDKETFFDRMIQAGETFKLNTRFDVCEDATIEFLVYDVDPEEKGKTLQESLVSTSCPGPWTLGGSVADGFTLEAFVDTQDSIVFDVHIGEVEVQLDYTAKNSGQYPLSVISGSVSDSEEDGFVAIDGLPVALDPRSRQVLLTTTEVIKPLGKAGEVVTYNFSVDGETANEFANPCDSEATLIFEL